MKLADINPIPPPILLRSQTDRTRQSGSFAGYFRPGTSFRLRRSVVAVAPPHKGRRNVAVRPQSFTVQNRRRSARYVLFGMQVFGAMNEPLRKLQRQRRRWIHGQAVRITVERGLIEVVPVLVGFPTGKADASTFAHL